MSNGTRASLIVPSACYVPTSWKNCDVYAVIAGIREKGNALPKLGFYDTHARRNSGCNRTRIRTDVNSVYAESAARKFDADSRQRIFMNV